MQHRIEVLHFFFHKKTADAFRFHKLCDRRSRRLIAVRGTERIVDEDVPVSRKLFRHSLALFGRLCRLFFMEADVFEHHNPAFRQRVDGGFLTERVGRKRDVRAELFFQIRGNGRHAVFTRDEFFFVLFGKRLSRLFRFFCGFFYVFRRIAEMAH